MTPGSLQGLPERHRTSSQFLQSTLIFFVWMVVSLVPPGTVSMCGLISLMLSLQEKNLSDTRNPKVCFGSPSPCTTEQADVSGSTRSTRACICAQLPYSTVFSPKEQKESESKSVQWQKTWDGGRKASWTGHSLRRWLCSLERDQFEWQKTVSLFIEQSESLQCSYRREKEKGTPSAPAYKANMMHDLNVKGLSRAQGLLQSFDTFDMATGGVFMSRAKRTIFVFWLPLTSTESNFPLWGCYWGASIASSRQPRKVRRLLRSFHSRNLNSWSSRVSSIHLAFNCQKFSFQTSKCLSIMQWTLLGTKAGPASFLRIHFWSFSSSSL